MNNRFDRKNWKAAFLAACIMASVSISGWADPMPVMGTRGPFDTNSPDYGTLESYLSNVHGRWGNAPSIGAGYNSETGKFDAFISCYNISGGGTAIGIGSYSSGADISFQWGWVDGESDSGLKVGSAFIGQAFDQFGMELIADSSGGGGAALHDLTVTGPGLRPGGITLNGITATSGSLTSALGTIYLVNANLRSAKLEGCVTITASGGGGLGVSFLGLSSSELWRTPRCVCMGLNTPHGFSCSDIDGRAGDGSKSPTGTDYANGGNDTSALGLTSEGSGGKCSTALTFNNQDVSSNYAGLSDAGTGWNMGRYPIISRSESDDVVIFSVGGNEIQFHEDRDSNGNITGYSPMSPGIHDKCIGGTTLVDSQGNQATYDGPDPGATGKIQSYSDTAGNTLHFYYDTNGRLTSLSRTVTQNSHTIVETFTFTAVGTGVNAGLPDHIVWTRSVDGGNATPIRSVFYDYYQGTYGGTDSYGNQGDLRSVAIIEGNVEDYSPTDIANHTLEKEYYRYYTPNDVLDTNNHTVGYLHGLKYAFNSKSLQRLIAGKGDPTQNNVSDSDVASFATKYLQYAGGQQVTLAQTQGSGCSCSGSTGQGTYTYQQQTNSNSDYSNDYNNWKTVTTETLPDGNQNIVYCNYAGEVMLKVNRVYSDPSNHTSSYTDYPHYNYYDGYGRVSWTAEPSGFAAGTANSNATIPSVYWDDTSSNLVMSPTTYISYSAGLFHKYTYDSYGYLQCEYAQMGEAAYASQTLRYLTYTDHTDANGVTIHPLATETIYRGQYSIAETTSYTYSWGSGSNQMLSRTTVKPAVTTDHNGPAASSGDTSNCDTTIEYFDNFGHANWIVDPGGYVTYTGYDVSTGMLAKQIVDVGSSTADSGALQSGDLLATDSVPSNLSLPGGSHLHLATTYGLDSLGRTTKLTGPNRDVTYTVYDDVNHEVRIYPGWNSSNNTTTGPTQVTREDRANNYTESFTITATPSVTGGQPDGTEAISGIQTLSRTLLDQSGRPLVTDRFFNLSGVTYSRTGGVDFSTSPPTINEIGTQNTNFYRTLQGYDAMGRRSWAVDAVGDVSRTTYDGLGRATGTWMGTVSEPISSYIAPSVPGNEIQLTANQYDGGNVGDSTLTQVTQYLDGTGTNTRVNAMYYDWRDRLVAIKRGISTSESDSVHRPIIIYNLDTQGQALTTCQYDGDGLTVSVDPWSGASVSDPTKLRAETVTNCDDQGRVYQTQTYSVDQSNGTLSYYTLKANNFYDHRGNLIAAYSPGGIVKKNVYDGAGRLSKTYTTDGATDNGWASASTVSGNNVLEQTANVFDANGNVVETISKSRNHDETGAGELGDPTTSPKARVTYSTAYYNAVNQAIANVVYGTDGSPLSSGIPSTIPTSSDTVLVTSTCYNPAGWTDKVTDPKGISTKTSYDVAGRVTQTTEDYTDGTPTNSTNRTTTYTYDGLDHTLTLTAVMPTGGSTPSQTTQYVYGTTTSTSDVNSNSLLATVKYPDKTAGTASSSASDQNSFTYDALGEVKTKIDQNGSVHTYSYDPLGRTYADTVTTLASGVDSCVRRIGISFDTGGRPYQLTSYSDTAGSTAVNQVQRSYNGFGQLVAEYQSHSGAVNTSTTPQVQYIYAGPDWNANYSRLSSITYPNGQQIYYLYTDSGDSSGVSDAISRVTSISTASTRGTNDANVLASYDYLGRSTVVRKNYPIPGLRLDRFGGTAGTYAGLDQFNRVINQEWTAYDVSTGTNTTNGDIFNINHGYDRDSNRLYADNSTHPSNSHAYTYDYLNRLTADKGGSYNSSSQSIDPVLQLTDHNWTLDPLGNHTSADSSKYQETFNAQNQIVTRSVSNGYRWYSSDFSQPANASNFSAAGANDTFNVNTTNANCLTITGLTSYSSESRGIVLFKQSFGHLQGYMRFIFDSGSSPGDEAGMVFGYKSINDYWIQAVNRDGYGRVYHVVNGTKTTISSYSAGTVAAGVDIGLYSNGYSSLMGWPVQTALSEGYPSGQIGFYTNRAGTRFDYYRLFDDGHPSDLLGRWDLVSGGKNVSNNRLNFTADADFGYLPILLRNLRLQKFQATFAIRREVVDANNNGAVFVFGAKDANHFNALTINHIGEGTRDQAPSGGITNGGAGASVSGTVTSGNLPVVSGTDVLWACVTCDDGTTVSVKLATGSTAPSDWSSIGVCYSSTGFDTSGGLFGFCNFYQAFNSVSNLTIKSYNETTSSFDTTELVETFPDTASETLTYDNNGNLNFDGVQAYTYDAWNRLKTVAHAYQDKEHAGHVFDTMCYDAAGRRITKSINGTGDMDCTYNYYVNGESVIEERNGSGMPLKQEVWGLQYVDELVQEKVNTYPYSGHTDCDTPYWVAQDANYNVLGVVDSTGTLRERYEYSAYGQRQVFFSDGSNDPNCYAPSPTSQRVWDTDTPALLVTTLCEFGHQGLMHDEETNLVYNRARMLNPTLGRFMQRDPLGDTNAVRLIEKLNVYAYEGDMPTRSIDPSGCGIVVTPRQVVGRNGFGVQFQQDSKCQCPGGSVNLVQAVQSAGALEKNSNFDSHKNYGVDPRVPPDPGEDPPGYVQGGGLAWPGKKNGSYLDAPIGFPGSTVDHFEVCAVCDSGGKKTIIQCRKFAFDEKTGQVTVDDPTSGPTSGIWQSSINDWKNWGGGYSFK
ncbi:MAG TPA: RHS repeat-associated core domain-containing protein [Phycisphaerae bacterium]|nr:RHS repeat-associated core domain-containing protein [Phycisphaerae bacterium]